MMNKLLPVCVIALIFLGSCKPPECIYCQVDGYPEGEVCRDTYETTLLPGTPSWKDYTEAALEDGCTEEP